MLYCDSLCPLSALSCSPSRGSVPAAGPVLSAVRSVTVPSASRVLMKGRGSPGLVTGLASRTRAGVSDLTGIVPLSCW
jgi:hypothetical protein